MVQTGRFPSDEGFAHQRFHSGSDPILPVSFQVKRIIAGDDFVWFIRNKSTFTCIADYTDNNVILTALKQTRRNAISSGRILEAGWTHKNTIDKNRICIDNPS